MRTKLLFVGIVLLLFVGKIAFSQSVSIELSVKWEKGFDIFKEDSIINIPKLNITYRNNSDTNYYFQKVSSDRKGYPMLPLIDFLQYHIEEYLHPNYLQRAKNHLNYEKENFKVRIGGDAILSRDWLIKNDTLDSSKEIEVEFDNANFDVAKIYDYIYRKNILNYSDSNRCGGIYFCPSDVSSDNINKTVRDRFVFLKPGEVYTDTYNLIGFQMIKGCFTFCIDSDCLKDYVLVESISCNMDVKTKLPKEIEGYKLYSGSFNTNKVILELR